MRELPVATELAGVNMPPETWGHRGDTLAQGGRIGGIVERAGIQGATASNGVGSKTVMGHAQGRSASMGVSVLQAVG